MALSRAGDARCVLDSRVAGAFYGRFKELRPAQQAAIEPLLAGRNVIIASGTGSGKTEAAAAPLVSRHLRAAFDADAVTLLYIAPTRALVNDLYKRLVLPMGEVGLRLGIRHGERDDLRSGLPPHVLITTPESLDVMLIRGDKALDHVRAVVIDEVHLLRNSQRGLHLSVLLRRLAARLGRAIQWAALSATVGDLRDTVDFLFGRQEQADLLHYPSGRPIDALVRRMASGTELARFMRRALEDGHTKVLLFADSRSECERLVEIITEPPGVHARVFAHYSSLSQDVRERTEAEFAASPGAVCVATSTLELGIDIGDIDMIALWGAPWSVESFLQRIGRGNRRSHTSNVACLIPDKTEDVLREALVFLALLDAARSGDLPRRSAFSLFGAFLQQSMSQIVGNKGAFTRLVDLAESVTPCGYCDREMLEEMLDELVGQEFLQRHGFQRRYGAGEGLWSLVDLRMIYGNFPVASSTVELRHAGLVLGEVPVGNLLRLKTGAVVAFGGRQWVVRQARMDHVELDSAGRTRSTVTLRYGGTKPGLDVFVAQRIWETLAGGRWDGAALPDALGQRVGSFSESVAMWSEQGRVPYTMVKGEMRYFTFAGRLINRTIAHVLGQDEAAADDLSLLATAPIDFAPLSANPEDYLEALDAVFEETNNRSFYQGLLPVEYQLQECRQPWLRDRTISAVLERLRSSVGAEVRASEMDLG